jgi:Dna[CI] antecedent, DciA
MKTSPDANRCLMERAARLLNQNKYARKLVGDEDVARGLWPAAVGKTIARHTGKVTLVRSRLVVEVEDAIWQRQLHGLTQQIVTRVQKLMGSTAVQDLEFRIAIPKRQPQRESGQARTEAIHPTVSDEADLIQDPVLKRVYRMSRKRATA